MIEIRRISKAFGAQQVLSGVTLTIESGKTTAILGPSGTGKSVLLKIITGLLDPDSGEVLIDGCSMTAASGSERLEMRRRMGVLFQGAALLDSMTIFDNVAFPLIERGERNRKTIIGEVHRRLDEVGLAEYSTALPGEISIGMRKRVGIARALIINPSIILFDEPNTGLDPESGQEIYELIQQTQRSSGFTGIVISHEIPEVFQVCDRVAMLYQGVVQAEGPVTDFRSEEHPSFKNPVVNQFFRGEIAGPISIG